MCPVYFVQVILNLFHCFFGSCMVMSSHLLLPSFEIQTNQKEKEKEIKLYNQEKNEVKEEN